MNAQRLKKTLLDLLAIPSPSGFTDEIVHYIGRELESIGLDYDLTRRGTIRARLPGSGEGPVRAVVNHVDTIGAMVRMIRSDGRVQVAPIGFWSSRFAEGIRVTLFSEHRAFRGTIMPVVEWGVSRDKGVESVPMDWDHVELRLDEAVFNADDVRALGIEVGDYIAFDASAEVLDNGFIVARNLDNKAGAAVVLESLRVLHETGAELTRDTYFLFTVTETIGFGAGSAVLPEVSELLTLDFASVPSTEKSPMRRVTIASADASGPYDYHLIANLKRIADEHGIPCQKKLLEAYHSDTASALAAGHDVRTAVIAYAGDAAHSTERTHIESLLNAGRLLIGYVTTEPTFAKDTAFTSVDQFSHQITDDNMPPQKPPVPASREVIRREQSGATGGDNKE
ncbi:MAG: osmoprotectant NAGGN system M42 family peptidase [Pseudomonadota bacterium]|nr:osmoprotectant NAGGN system M42 family peptidase [Pseudomonadota bacterium]